MQFCTESGVRNWTTEHTNRSVRQHVYLNQGHKWRHFKSCTLPYLRQYQCDQFRDVWLLQTGCLKPPLAKESIDREPSSRMIAIVLQQSFRKGECEIEIFSNESLFCLGIDDPVWGCGGDMTIDGMSCIIQITHNPLLWNNGL